MLFLEQFWTLEVLTFCPVLQMSLQHNKSAAGAALPLSLSGLLSPRHMAAHMGQPKDMSHQQPRESALNIPHAGLASHQSTPTVNGLISPARMYPSNFSPLNPQSSTPPTVAPKPLSPPSTPPKPLSSSPPSLGPKPGLVYLRQDQNIPENFCDKFRPIQPDSDTNIGAKVTKTECEDIKNISSDDIVVTLHSVNV